MAGDGCSGGEGPLLRTPDSRELQKAPEQKRGSNSISAQDTAGPSAVSCAASRQISCYLCVLWILTCDMGITLVLASGTLSSLGRVSEHRARLYTVMICSWEDGGQNCAFRKDSGLPL